MKKNSNHNFVIPLAKKVLTTFVILLMGYFARATVITVVNTNNTGSGSLRDAVAVSTTSDTIRFSPSLISGGSDTIKLSSEIAIPNNIVIIGLYNITDTLYISGQNACRIFNFQGSDLVLDSLALINGRAANGGALYCSTGPVVTISNSIFKGNSVTVKGGAIYAEFGDLNIQSTVFENNSATSDGGAIYCLGAQNVTTYQTLFSGNTSGFTGGAMYMGGSSTSVFYLQKTRISENTSAYDGGGLYCKGRYFYMDSCIVNNNTATSGTMKSIVSFGGLNKFEIYVDNSEFVNNTGLGISSQISLGVSVNTESKMYINRCTFDSNTLGGIYSEVFADNANSSGILEVNYSTVANNGNATSTCGGIYSAAWGFGTGYSFNSNVKVKNSTIVNNSSGGNGSGVFSKGKLAFSSYLEVKSSIVANNSGINLLSFSTASSITSQGNNIFSNATVLGSVASDQSGVSNAGLNLGTLDYNGGFTRTLRPNTGSVAIDLGNISDLSDAQNGPISGRRDIGSTEWVECIKTHSFMQTICYGDSILFNAVYRKTTGAYSQTINLGTCDSIVTMNLTVLPANTSSQTLVLCAGESVTVGSNTYSTSGTYTDILTAANGCDSTVTTYLTISPAISGSQTLVLCAGESVTVGSHTYSTSGTYTDMLAAANGCDSTVTTYLTVNPAISGSQTLVLCAGESVTVGSNTYSTSGTYTDIFTAANGCDSTVTTYLTVNPAISGSQTLVLCAGESVTVGSHTYSTSGTYTDIFTAANGCDSTVTTYLTINPAISGSQTLMLCAGESVTVGSHTYSASGTYTDILTAANGCDSTVTTYLTVNPALSESQTLVLCAGESVTVGSHTYSTSGTYTDIFTAANGCDSTVTTYLTVSPAISESQTLVLCAGESVTVGSNTYSTSGTYTDILTTANGCDSTVTTYLTVNPAISGSQTLMLCAGESVTVGSHTYSTSGTYTDILTAANGCDSTVTTYLTISPAISGSQTLVLCAGESVTVGSHTYSTSGTYTDIFTAANGCDSTFTTYLTVNPAISGSQTLVLCAGESVTVGSHTYSASGTYTDIFTAANGCDSTVTTYLTINPAISESQTLVLCAGESVTVGSHTYSTSGTYTDILTTANGCDSTVTTYLTISPAISGSQTLVLCAGESVTVGSNTYSTSGTYTDILTAANGCDSTVTTYLTISPAIDITTFTDNQTITANQSGATYQWINCDNANMPLPGESNQSYTATENGNYAVIITQNACSDTSACVNISTVYLNETEPVSEIQLFPNPTTRSFTVSGIEPNAIISVYNLTGESVMLFQSSANCAAIDLDNNPEGIYLVKISYNSSETILKLIKVNQ